MMHHHAAARLKFMEEPDAQVFWRESEIQVRDLTTGIVIVGRIVYSTSLEELAF